METLKISSNQAGGFMMKGKLRGFLGTAVLLAFAGCAGGPQSGRPGDPIPDSKGNLIVQNQSGVELAFYVDKAYKKTAKSGARLTINVDYAEAAGTIVELECFYLEKIGDVSAYPNDQSAKYYSFAKVVRPLGSPEPVVPINIPALSSEDLSTGVGLNSVLVKFSYNDYPRVDSAVSVFTGSIINQNPIVRLQNGDTMFVPMKVGLNQINVEYVVSGKNTQRKAYPQNDNQRNDNRFLVYVPSDVTEGEHVVPRIDDIFNVNLVTSSPAARGTLRVRNDSSKVVNIRYASGAMSERPINGADSVVMKNRRRDFPINNGDYILRAVDAVGGGYTEIAEIEDLKIEPGMIYYWFIKDQSNTLDARVNTAVSQQIKNWFQTWMIESAAGTKISLRIASTAKEVQNSRRELGVTGRDGYLKLPDVDIENLIRGLTTDNAKRVILTLTAEKEGCESVSQSISAFGLLSAGTEFRPERFELTKIETPETAMKDGDFVIGDPKIQ
jgi:hypothetical protein